MFGLTFEKLLLIGVIAAFLLGPDRLPHYAAMLARLVRQLRDMGRNAQDRFKEEMGPEYADMDWKKLNPRQYDPRRIIRDALRDEAVAFAEPVRTASAPTAAATAVVSPVGTDNSRADESHTEESRGDKPHADESHVVNGADEMAPTAASADDASTAGVSRAQARAFE